MIKYSTYRNAFLTVLLTCTVSIFGAGNAAAQLLDDAALDTLKTYRSLESALANPSEVYILDLTGEKLSIFPPEIFEFKNLNVLILDRNKLKRIPNEISELVFLQKVSINKNKLDQWPLGLTNLPNLRELSMNRNFIESIPADIYKNKSLERLDLWSNDLVFFPKQLAELSNLVWMDLRVIQMNEETQNRIQGYLPKARVEFDPACNCNF